MSVWDSLSVLALAAASLPSIYFAGRTWTSHPEFAKLSALLATALLVHASYHLAVVFGGPPTVVVAVEAASASMIFAFAVFYWRGREKLE